LLTEETRWGILANRLPDPFDQKFRSIVEELHVIIFYRRQLPLDAKAEYKRWREVVGKFIDDLEAAQKR
jgi:hypothetical protein